MTSTSQFILKKSLKLYRNMCLACINGKILNIFMQKIKYVYMYVKKLTVIFYVRIYYSESVCGASVVGFES